MAFGSNRLEQRRSSVAIARQAPDGAKRFLKIGRYGEGFTPDLARTRAKDLIGQIARGDNPAAKIAEARAAITVADLADEYPASPPCVASISCCRPYC